MRRNLTPNIEEMLSECNRQNSRNTVMKALNVVSSDTFVERSVSPKVPTRRKEDGYKKMNKIPNQELVEIY